jgi:hypothetical protein
MVELAVVEAPGRAAIGDLRLLDAPEDGVELALADMEGVVVAFELGVVVEQQRQRLVDAHRHEISGSPAPQTKQASEERGGGHFVAHRHDGVVERDGHGRLPIHRQAGEWRRAADPGAATLAQPAVDDFAGLRRGISARPWVGWSH